jgi:hypothetical protein
MNAKFTFLAAALLACAGAVHATDLNYDYVEVGYSQIDFDDFNEDLKGVFIGGSFLVAEEIFMFGEYFDGKTDRFQGGRIGFTTYTLGVGYRLGIGPQTDLNFAAAFERARVEGRGNLAFLGSDSENGYSLTVGLRHLVTRQFELAADVTHVDISDDDTILTVGGLLHISDLVAVGLAYFVGSDADGYSGNIRFKF